MFEILMKVPERDLLGLIVSVLLIGCTTLVLLTSILMRAWTRFHQRQLATPLVQEMLERGMEPAEIENIFEAAWTARPGFIRAFMQRLFGKRRKSIASAS